MYTKPNSWLISNSAFYFGGRLLSGDLPLNANSIFDLSKISETILFADKILTLPGIDFHNTLYRELEREGLCSLKHFYFIVMIIYE